MDPIWKYGSLTPWSSTVPTFSVPEPSRTLISPTSSSILSPQLIQHLHLKLFTSILLFYYSHNWSDSGDVKTMYQRVLCIGKIVGAYMRFHSCFLLRGRDSESNPFRVEVFFDFLYRILCIKGPRVNTNKHDTFPSAPRNHY